MHYWKLLIILTFFQSFVLRAQEYTIKGKVVDSTTNEALPGVNIFSPDMKYLTVSDKYGAFSIEKVKDAEILLKFSFVGYKKHLEELKFADGLKWLNVKLRKEDLSLETVVVTAQKSAQDVENKIVIGSQAIKHVQAFSLSDVMQLLPGKLMENPYMAGAQRLTLREIDGSNMNNLGTSILVDGAPVASDAGLTTNILGESLSGTDLREISADNIESVEVIQGVPSVQYGDLTSGTVMVKSKIGKEPLYGKIRLNPTTEQATMGKGYLLGEATNMNVDLDFTKAQSDQRISTSGYHRLGTNIGVARKFFKKQSLYFNARTKYSYSFSGDRHDPAEGLDSRFYFEKHSVSFNTYGNWYAKKRWLWKLKYNVSFNYSDKHSYDKEVTAGSLTFVPLGEPNVMTEAEVVPYMYTSELFVDDRPFGFYGNVMANFFIKSGDWKHDVMYGLNYKSDKNFGKGVYYDRRRPPKAYNTTKRVRPSSELPALEQYSLFIEDNMQKDLWGREFKMKAGLRFCNFQPLNVFDSKFATSLEPRVNVSYALTKKLKIRGSYGLTSRSAPLTMISPNDVYFDELNMKNYDGNPDHTFVYSTTYVFSAENPMLKLAKARKQEYSVRYAFGKNALSLTYYSSCTNNGYGNEKRVVYLPMDVYNVIIEDNPHYEYDHSENRIRTFNAPGNNKRYIDRGLEFVLDIGRINAINTYFSLSGSYMFNQTNTIKDYIRISDNDLKSDDDLIPVYSKGEGSKNKRFSTVLRAVYNLPRLNFVASWNMQTQWYTKRQNIRVSPYATAYIQNDKRYELSEEEAKSEKYASLKRIDSNYIYPPGPPLFLFNLKLTKNINKHLGFAFNANNFFYHRPVYKNSRQNPRLYFGGELSYKL
ncbi:TonB-dependent receptor [Puteibacter caeruleilacunae]|nr:TonB-dependent receptor [Puteibacter caeruleilacunae]